MVLQLLVVIPVAAVEVTVVVDLAATLAVAGVVWAAMTAVVMLLVLMVLLVAMVMTITMMYSPPHPHIPEHRRNYKPFLEPSNYICHIFLADPKIAFNNSRLSQLEGKWEAD